MHFYPHNIPDFNNSTRHLTRVERSVYRDAIERYYDTESVLTKDFEVLAKRLLCFSDEEKTALKSILKEFFIETDEGYFHERCDAEIIKYRANTSAKAKAGKASALSRIKKATEKKRKSTGVEQPLNSVEQNNNYELGTNNQLNTDTPQEKNSEEKKQDPLPTQNYVDHETWESFLIVRKGLKAKNSAIAIKALITQLEKLMAQGFDPKEVVLQSIRASWKDLYAIKGAKTQTANQKSVHETRAETAQAMFGDRNHARTIDVSDYTSTSDRSPLLANG